MPGFDKVLSLFKVLGIEFYIGPSREPAPPATRVAEPDSQYGSPPAEDRPPAWVEDLRSEIRELATTLELSGKGSARQVEIRELAAAAGSGSTDLNETLIGHVDFQREWLDRHAIDPTQCTMITVRGDSMEPTLPEGCAILVDRNRKQRLVDHIFVVRSDNGVIVKRAGKDDDNWLLVSDNGAEYSPVPWPEDAVIIGEVKWLAKTL